MSSKGEAKQGSKITYKSSGVDVEKADSLVEWMKSSEGQGSQHKERLVSGIGGFAALFDGSFPQMQKPLLVSSTDGIGTKLLMGLASKKTKMLAQDLVAMCVNDLLCTGAQPLFFLDYFATSNLEEEALKDFITCLKKSCYDSGVALIGGETAEVPGLYSKGHFDAAGFSVGVVDQEKAWSSQKVSEGDVVLALASSGFHSNGYSLLRKIFGEDGGDFADQLMEPTRLYWPFLKEIYSSHLYEKISVAAHITGGGMDNVARILPEGLGVELESWEWTDLIKESQKRSGLNQEEMLKTFNCGLGFILIVKKEFADEICQKMNKIYADIFVSKGKVVKTERKWRLI